MNDAKVAYRIREKVAEFSGKVSAGLPRSARRLVREVVYGMQSRGSVRLSEIARRIKLNKTSVFRYFNALFEHGYLQKGSKNKLYAVLPDRAQMGCCRPFTPILLGRKCYSLTSAKIHSYRDNLYITDFNH